MLSFDALIQGDFQVFFNSLRHLLLPSLALSMPGIGQVSRITRASMLEIGTKDYISVMHSYGVPDGIINFIYMLNQLLYPV